MCPKPWQDQYDLTQDSLPQSIRKLLGILENIKKVVSSSKFQHQGKGHEGMQRESHRKKVNERVLIPMNFKFPIRRKLRKAVCCARIMGVHIRSTIPVSAISTRKLGLLKRVSVERQPLD